LRVHFPAQVRRAAVDATAPSTQGHADARGGGTFAALVRYPTFRRLWLGSLGTSLGQWMQQVGLGWLALSLTDSPFFVGLVGFMAGLPFLLVSIPAGVLADRLDRRRLLLACQAGATALALLVTLDILMGWVEPWHLLVAAFVTGSFQAVMTPTQQSLVPGLVAREDLTNAIGLSSAGMNITRAAGPFVAGAMIGVAGVSSAFVLQAAALVVAFVLVAGISIPVQGSKPAVAGVRGALEGVALIAGRPDLRALFLLACIPTFFVFPYIQFLSVFARDILRIGPGGLGVLMAASGLGAVAGSLLTAARGELARAGRLLIALTVVYGGFVVGMAESRSVYLSVPLLVMAGACGAMYMSTNNAQLQLRITDEVRGRVMAAYVLTWGLMPLGAMPMGIAADRFGTPAAVAAGAILSSTFAAALGVRSRALREL
jgi:MFS family permease